MDAIYARQSIDKKDSLSIEGQIELCRKYAGDDVRIFQDKGFSGKNTKTAERHFVCLTACGTKLLKEVRPVPFVYLEKCVGCVYKPVFFSAVLI